LAGSGPLSRVIVAEPALGRRVHGRHYVRAGEQRRYPGQYFVAITTPLQPAVLPWREFPSMIFWWNY
jgi:hypothetical protein